MSQSLVAPTQSIEEVVGKIVNGFQFLDDWTARYEYLIDLGRAMPPFPMISVLKRIASMVARHRFGYSLNIMKGVSICKPQVIPLLFPAF